MYKNNHSMAPRQGKRAKKRGGGDFGSIKGNGVDKRNIGERYRAFASGGLHPAMNGPALIGIRR